MRERVDFSERKHYTMLRHTPSRQLPLRTRASCRHGRRSQPLTLPLLPPFHPSSLSTSSCLTGSSSPSKEVHCNGGMGAVSTSLSPMKITMLFKKEASISALYLLIFTSFFFLSDCFLKHTLILDLFTFCFYSQVYLFFLL
ncbi:hypothetical protein AMTRI_Chr12g233820 [Amborella trichopoda]